MRWVFFKNSLRKSSKKALQIFSLGFLLAILFIGTFSVFAVNGQISQAYQQFQITSNMRDIVMQPDSTYRLVNPTKQVENQLPENQELYEQYILNQLAIEHNFNLSKTEEWTINNLTNQNQRLKLKVVSKFNFTDDDNGVDQLVLQQGQQFATDYQQARYQAIITPQFAKANNIHINDVIRLQPDEFGTSLLVNENPQVADDLANASSLTNLLSNSQYYGLNWFEVIGFASSVDYSYPVFDMLSFYPKTNHEALVYLDARNLGFSDYAYQIVSNQNESAMRNLKIYNSSDALISLTSEFDRYSYYSLKSNTNSFAAEQLNQQFKFYAKLTNNAQYFFTNDDKTFQHYSRIHNVTKIISVFNLATYLLILVSLSISLFIFFLISKKDIELRLGEIGYLKSMGYTNNKIIYNFVTFIGLSCLVGFGLGMICFSLIETSLISAFSTIFTFSFTSFNALVWWQVCSLIVVLGFLLIINYLICIRNFNRPIVLLNSGIKTSKIGWWARAYKSLYRKKRFKLKLRAALLISSLPKVIGISFAMLLCATLTTTVIIIPEQMRRNYDSIFANIYYKNKIEYTTPLANNPLSFLKTYNPSFQDEQWGFDFDNKLTRQYIGSKSKENVSTAYPLLDDQTIDWAKVTDDILHNNINTDYYSYDIAKKHNTAWAEFSWLNWKNLSTSFLLELDHAEIDDSFGVGQIGAGQTMNNIYGQWADHATLTSNLAQLKKQPANHANLTKFTNSLLNFYKKYIGGIPLTYNPNIFTTPNIINDKKFNNVAKKGIVGINDYKNFWNIPNAKNYSDNFYPTPTGSDFIFTKDDEQVNLKTLSIEQLSDWTDEEILRLNNNLTIWFTSIFEWRLGMAIIMLTYTNSPYYVQQKIINALETDTDFTISNSIIPYNPEFDELGTSFKAISEQTNFDVFGVNRDSQLNLLFNQKNELINSSLFQDSDEEYHIVINQALAKKLDLEVNDMFDLHAIVEKLVEPMSNNQVRPLELDQVEMGWTKAPYQDFRTQSSRSYYSSPRSKNDSRSFADTNALGIPQSFNSASLGGKQLAITNNGAIGASKPPPIHQQVTGNQLMIKDVEIIPTKTFKVVGVEKSYGKPQAWVSNQNANQIIGYDQIQKFNFENFFVPEWVFVNQLYTFDNFADEGLKTFLQTSPKYETFVTQVDHNKNQAWTNMQTFYNNLYPVFNYKISANPQIDDLTIGLSNTQRYGDYSDFGTRGSYELITPPNCENGECELIINKDNYYQGFSIPSVKTLSPIDLTKSVIEEISIKLNLVIYIFICVLMMITLIILILATTLIIEDNQEFINTMKVLGYANLYVINQVFSLYNLKIIVMFCVGVGLGIYTIWSIIKLISDYSSFVFFTTIIWWYPLTIFLGLFVLYGLTFLLSWHKVKQIRL